MSGKADEIRHLNFLALVLFPAFCVAHGVFWHACKFYDDEDGLCIQWFGDSEVLDLTPEVTSSSKPLANFFRSVLGKRKNRDQELEPKMSEQQSFGRMELIREANFAMAFLCLLGTWLNRSSTGSTSNTGITLQLFLVETAVVCAATYDAFLSGGDPTHGSVLILAGWAVLAFSGFLMTLGLQCSPNFRALMGSLTVARGGTAKPPTETKVVKEDVPEATPDPIAPEETTTEKATEAEVVEETKKAEVPPATEEDSSITVTVTKKTKDSFVGIGLIRKPGDSRILIASLSPKGLFGSQNDLQAGQVLVSINGTPASQFSSAADAAATLKKAAGDITIVAKSASELPLCLDESSILVTATKDSLESVVGVGLMRRQGDWRILIESLAPEGLFGSDSKLRIGQTVLAINNTPASAFASVEQATTLLKEATGKISILVTRSLTVTVQKAKASSKVGLAFSKRKISGSDKPTHHFMVHKVDPTGLFGPKNTSVGVKEGMRILAINGHPCIPTSTTINEFSVWVKECVGPLSMVLLPEQAATPAKE